MKTKLLFPNQFKRIGWILLVPSTILGILIIFFDFKFKLLDSDVFTIYNKGFLDSSGTFFGFFRGNYLPTMAGIIFLIGAIFVAFSKEKHEDEFIAKTRLESLVWATYVNYAILIFCFLFFFDLEFMLVMIFNMFTVLVFFIIRFYFILYKTKKSLSNEKYS
jgi:hypothetical protein